MTRRIYKYSAGFDPGDELSWYEMRIPVGAEIVMVGMQGRHFCIWAIVDPDAPLDEPLVILPTGAEVPDGLEHIGTFQMSGAIASLSVELVWHIFRRSGK